jgi:hypothetical protein
MIITTLLLPLGHIPFIHHWDVDVGAHDRPWRMRSRTRDESHSARKSSQASMSAWWWCSYRGAPGVTALLPMRCSCGAEVIGRRQCWPCFSQYQRRLVICGAWSLSFVPDWWHGSYLLDLNKVGGPKIPSCVKMMKIYRMPIPADMAGLSCSVILR